MGISRVQKFKDYRNSLIKEDAPILETPQEPKEINQDNRKTTSTLPMDEVIKTLQKDDAEAVFIRKQKIKHVLKYILIGLGIAVAIAGIVILTVAIWRR